MNQAYISNILKKQDREQTFRCLIVLPLHTLHTDKALFKKKKKECWPTLTAEDL